MEPTLHSWNGVLWRVKNSQIAFAHCPVHQGVEMDVRDSFGDSIGQEHLIEASSITQFTCPMDGKNYELTEDYFTLRRRIIAITKSDAFKNARIVDLDNMYTPILKVDPKPKDDRYSIQVEIDETPHGKKMVIYAMDRENPTEKTQIFIDPQLDKISFDGRGDLHPNAIFSKVVAYFNDNRSATLEEKKE